MKVSHSEIISSKYQKIAVEVAKRIANGEYEVGEKLKSRTILATQFNVSAETARKGLNILADMKILTLKHGSGAIVLSQEKAIEFLENYEITHSISVVKEHIRDRISKQEQGLAQLSELINEFLLQSQLVSRHSPLTPYELILTKDTEHLGKSISDLNIWHNTGATVIAIEHDGELILSPSPYTIIEKGDHLFFVGDNLAHSRMEKFFQLSQGLLSNN
ncbi:TrkA C-terminal domain-containing protein [Streptococcus ferus]|uniref:GntR family transcriptional regulator n=1 Tax=Streptococcus ferus TaxID=1345 RepID=A0A2X3XXP7_9STRE|nr:TrkA C-terminal domain-containing protein [Streptococcus ferus]SQF39192.1 GntR family transcriptional regulator [Streptococcus ferus]